MVDISFIEKYRKSLSSKNEIILWEITSNIDSNVLMLIGRKRTRSGSHSTKLMRTQEQALAKEGLIRFQILQEVLQTKRAFIRCVSHEVRSPLSVILQGINFLEELCTPLNNATISEVITDIQLSCASAMDIMLDLLTYERIESRTLQLEKVELDFHDLIEQNILHSVVTAKQKDIRLTLNINEDDQIYIHAAPSEMGLAIRNLLVNAVRFTPVGGRVEARVHSHGSNEADYIRFEVSDTGDGLTEGDQAELMDQIQRFSPTVNDVEQGHGVGFFVCHGIVKMHGGRVGVQSEGIGLGSTYFIDMPVAHRKKRSSQGSSKKVQVMHQGSHLNKSEANEPLKVTVVDVGDRLKRGRSGLQLGVNTVKLGKLSLVLAVKYLTSY